MKLECLALLALVLSTPAPARAEEGETLQQRVDRLEADVEQLRARIDHLGPVSGARQVRVVDPVFIGAGSASPSPLAMDNPIINCSARSFVSAVQVLKTGNTVSQIRYACRGIE